MIKQSITFFVALIKVIYIVILLISFNSSCRKRLLSGLPSSMRDKRLREVAVLFIYCGFDNLPLRTSDRTQLKFKDARRHW